MEVSMTKYHELKKNQLKERIIETEIRLNRKLKILIFTDESDNKTDTYLKSKVNMFDELGILYEKVVVSKERKEEMIVLLEETSDPSICLYPIDSELEAIYKQYCKYDIDGEYKYNELTAKNYDIIPATAKGIYLYIKENFKNIESKSFVLVGYGNLVNKPLSMLLCNERATVTVISSNVDSVVKHKVLSEADIVVCASGKKDIVKTSMLKKGSFVFNVGTIFENGKLSIELTVDDDNEIYYTPRIKGVGILTVLALVDNAINFFNKEYKGGYIESI